ncbi:MAG: hypothetical protein WCL08_08815 [Verrucomicrobiota bacterium]
MSNIHRAGGSGATDFLDCNTHSEFHDPSFGQTEEGAGRFCNARKEGEYGFPPECHPALLRWNDGLASEKEGDLLWVAVEVEVMFGAAQELRDVGSL